MRKHKSQYFSQPEFMLLPNIIHPFPCSESSFHNFTGAEEKSKEMNKQQHQYTNRFYNEYKPEPEDYNVDGLPSFEEVECEDVGYGCEFNYEEKEEEDSSDDEPRSQVQATTNNVNIHFCFH